MDVLKNDGVESPESAPLEMVDISLEFHDLIGAHVRRLLSRQPDLTRSSSDPSRWVYIVMMELGGRRILGVWLGPGTDEPAVQKGASIFAGKITPGARDWGPTWREYEVDPMIRGHRIKQLLRSESQALLMIMFWNQAILSMSPLTEAKFSVHHPTICNPHCPHYGIIIKDKREEIDRHAATIPEGG